MKKIFIILAVAAAAVACIKEEMTAPSNAEGQTIFTGEFLNTKIALGDKENGVYPAEWEADDQLAIYDAASNTLLGTAAITSESVGQRMGTFVLNQTIADGTKVKVVYPATEISGVAAEQTKASAADKHLIAKAESEEITIQNQQAAFALTHKNAIVKVDVNSSEFAGKLLKSVTIYSAGAVIANDSDYARVTFTAPAAVSAGEIQSAVFMTLPVTTNTDFYVSVKLVDPADELRTISIPKKFTAKQLKAGQVNTIPFTSLATTDNAVAWYNPVCNRYIPEGGWCYGNSNTYMCSTTIGTTGTFDVRACGDFLDVIKNAREPKKMRNRMGDIINTGTGGVWSFEGVKTSKGSATNLKSFNPTIIFNENTNAKPGVAGFWDLLDADGKVIWAFVLWAINDDSAVNYTAGSVMKYNLGGGKNDGDNSGALYQWGRPFPFGYGSALQTIDASLRITSFKQSAENAISPGLIDDSSVNADWWQDGTHKNDLWGNPSKDKTSTGGKKSIFDPCPQGWKVASVALLTEICNTGKIISGKNFTVGETDIWPYTRYRGGDKGSLGGSGKGLYWADNVLSDTHGQLFEYSGSGEKGEIKSTWKSNACGVRCMKDTENR